MELLRPRVAAEELGVSYPTLKQWIYRGRLQSVTTPGGHHRIPRTEIDRISREGTRGSSPKKKRRQGVTISGRNKLRGRVVSVQHEGLLSQIQLDVGGQIVTSIITRAGADEMRLRVGVEAAALIKATEVMIIRG
jgi:molybdopterin-binding protein